MAKGTSTQKITFTATVADDPPASNWGYILFKDSSIDAILSGTGGSYKLGSIMEYNASVTSGGEWLSITSGSSGSNSGTITCSYSANTTTSSRTGTIRVTANGATGSPQDVIVTQAADSENSSYQVLTPQSPDITIYNGESVKVFGCAGVNTVNLSAGGKAECVNFIGANVINIEDSASGFTVRPSGATVYLENATTGTSIKIPATKTSQTLTFAGGVSYPLIISSGKVMFGSREVTLTAEQI